MVTYFVFEVRLSGLHSVDADVEAGVGWGDDIGRVSIHHWHAVLRLGVWEGRWELDLMMVIRVGREVPRSHLAEDMLRDAESTEIVTCVVVVTHLTWLIPQTSFDVLSAKKDVSLQEALVKC